MCHAGREVYLPRTACGLSRPIMQWISIDVVVVGSGEKAGENGLDVKLDLVAKLLQGNTVRKRLN